MLKIKLCYLADIDTIGGVYGALGSFGKSLYNTFNNDGRFECYTLKECIESKINFDVAIGLNGMGYQAWEDILKTNAKLLIWTVDSIFYQNYFDFSKYFNYENFIMLQVTQSDNNAIKHFNPELKYGFFPHAIDEKIWQNESNTKENDIVFFSSVSNIEKDFENLKSKYNPDVNKLINLIYNYALKNPTTNFYTIFSILAEKFKFNLSANEYAHIFNDTVYLITNTQKIEALKALSRFNIKVFGNEIWKKYIQNNAQYCGKVSYEESIKITANSKIALHIQPYQTIEGSHERPLGASLVNTNVICNNTKWLQNEFNNAFSFFDTNNLDSLTNICNLLLNDSDLREKNASNAIKLIKTNHLYKNRVDAIANLFNIKE